MDLPELSKQTTLYYRKHSDEWVTDVLKRHLWSKQREIIKSVFENRRTVVAASFDVGKSFVAACTALAFLYLFPLSKVITTAPTYTQVARILWSEIRALYRTALEPEDYPGRCLTTELNIEPDWFMIGISPRWGYNFQGYHALNVLVVLDEAPGILEEIKSDVAPKDFEPHPLDGAITELKSVYNVAVEMDDAQAALQTVQEPVEVLVRAIQENLVREEPEETLAEPTVESSLAQMLSEFKNEIGQEIGLLRAEVAASKTPATEPVDEQAPPRRSIRPELVLQPTEPKSATPNLKVIVDRSVGL